MKIVKVLAIILALTSCVDSKKESVENSVKQVSGKFLEVSFFQKSQLDSLSINENSYIFDTIFNIHKANLVAYTYMTNIKKSKKLIVNFRKNDHHIFQKEFSTTELDTLRKFYSLKDTYIQLQKAVFSTFNAEEQWNITTALISLKAEDYDFESTDYFDYLLKASSNNENECTKLRSIHLLIQEVKMKDFWKKGGERKDASGLTRKFNEIAKIIECEPIIESDSLFPELDKLK